ncbi:MAG: glycosyl transferase family 1 [Bacteroidetes bacterium]|nr:MAG: glycosyl transferase family 1 [Bacteroidota bacterium]
MNSKKNIVILYTELSGYVLSCLKALANKSDVNVTVVHWPIKTEAPFHLPTSANFQLIERSNFSRDDIISTVKSKSPDLLIISGWLDEDYLAVARVYLPVIPVVLTIDNHWEGTIKQWFAVISSPFFIRKHFNYAWVPGAPQTNYVSKLGFSKNKIKTGFYSADTELFTEFFRKRERSSSSKKKLLFIGRYIERKGVIELWEEFIKLSSSNDEWELHCVGVGELWEKRPSHPKIFHHGFLQPQDMAPLITSSEAFVMPSHFEPWGVALHEMSAAGLPLIASDAVGATTMFLNHGENGWIYKNGDNNALSNCLTELYISTESKLDQMGIISHELASRLTPDIWAETALNFLLCNKLNN